jgi:glycosyltransferase involved in cell wall biosynthesis
MKILIWSWGRRGGGPKYAYELVKELAKIKGLDLHLSLSKQCEIIAEYDMLELPEFNINTYSSIGSALGALFRLFIIRYRFWSYVKRENFDVLLCPMSHIWNYAMLIGKRKRPPFILVAHDAKPHPGDDYFIRNLLLSQEINQAQGIVTLTRSVRDAICNKYNYPQSNTSVIPHGVFPYSEYKSIRASGTIQLLFFGRILPYKGLDLLLKAYAIILDTNLPVHLHIAGPGNLKPYVKSLAVLKHITVDNRWIPEDEIGSIFKAADVCVCPYSEASQSGVIATAYAAGIPVIVTPIGGLIEQVQNEKTGLICKEISSEAIVDAITRIVIDSDLRIRCSEGAVLEASSVLSWPVISRQFNEFINKIIL